MRVVSWAQRPTDPPSAPTNGVSGANGSSASRPSEPGDVQQEGRAITDCVTCPMGAAADVGRGGRCPLVERRRPAGAALYLAGEPIDRVYFVKRGSVLLSREAGEARGEGIPWAVRGPGALLGVEGLVHSTYLDSARCVTEAAVCAAPKAEIRAWIRACDAAPHAMLECVLRSQCTDAPRRAGSDGSAVSRVARWLLDGKNGEGQRRSSSLPRRVVAGLLGMQPETLSRALATLAARGAVTVTRRRVDIVDRPKLEGIATE